jgi:hypothetical protein
MQEWWQRTCTAVLWVTLCACATVTTPATWQPGNLQPLILGWQGYFEIVWEVTRQDRDVLIEGYITNTWGFAVREVSVLVNGYDSSGAQTGQVIAWGPNAIQPGDRVYFDVTVPAGAATYDVSIFSWKWTWPPSGGAGRDEEESRSAKRAANERLRGPLTPASSSSSAASIVRSSSLVQIVMGLSQPPPRTLREDTLGHRYCGKHSTRASR